MLDRPNAPRALLLNGTGRYAAPEHPTAAASEALAALLKKAGFDVVIAADVEAALAWLSSPWNWPELLAVNVGLPDDGLPVPDDAAAAGLRSWLGSARPLLAVNASSTSFTAVPEWDASLGGGVVPHTRAVSYVRPDGGRTFHDARGPEAGSFESDERREDLARGIAWLAESLGPSPALGEQEPGSL